MSTRGPDESSEALRSEIQGIVSPKFPGIEVEIGASERWNRPCVTFRWAGFSGLLPEERFHRLCTVLNEEFRDQKLPGFVWLELAPEESVEEFMALPRSDDVASREGPLYGELVRRGVFDDLSKAMGPSPAANCRGAFDEVLTVLAGRKFTDVEIRDCKLSFMRHGAFCDCQVLLEARSSLDATHAGAA